MTVRLQFLGAATTVTGSQYLLTTERARILIDCGMFQGSPNESIRNRIPLAYDPTKIDAMLLTHAHLDHCGLIPHVVKAGFTGPIWATRGTVELATLVLLDSGKLQEEFAKRGMRWEKRHPDEAAVEDKRDEAALEAAVELAEAGEAGTVPPPTAPPPTSVPPTAVPPTTVPSAPVPLTGVAAATVAAFQPTGSAATGEHVPTTIEPALAIPEDAGGAGIPEAVSAPTPAFETAPALARARDPEQALKAQPAHLDIDLDEPLYDEDDAKASLANFRGLDYGAEFEVAPGIHATFVDAGHILGSAIIRLRVTDRDGEPEMRIVFSGDIGRTDTPILRDPTVVTDAEYVLVESTYGGREHEPEAEAIQILAETVRLVGESDGVLLVPSFAIGRTQEVVWELDRLLEAGKIPPLPLYLDSPMASKASDVYRHHPDYYDEETTRLLATEGSPLDYPHQIVVNDFAQSQAIVHAPRPYMIVASNGMLTGGRVVGHLRNLIDDPRAVILFVGYQGEGTLGAHLQAGAKTVKLDGQVRAVHCQVRSISGFSAHADESELLDWLRPFATGKQPGAAGLPRRVFIVHGDPDAQLALEPKVRALGLPTHIPVWHEVVELV
ncbi:MAG TPA: MBL fold metallo-hydrolase [Candidatus Acidoferrum sp.]|nr:MBL fold metallo-hydrolase [Candidatus Acidoferrum sp.]